MIIKNTESEFESMVQIPTGGGKSVETRIVVKMLPSQVNIMLGRFGRIQNREVVTGQMPFDDALGLYKFLKRRFAKLDDAETK